MDKAGQGYWDAHWKRQGLRSAAGLGSVASLPAPFDAFLLWIERELVARRMTSRATKLVEVGCARSVILPALHRRLDVTIAGIDYSPVGCEQARKVLQELEIAAEILCVNVFDCPQQLREGFDVVISFGLVEHFSDTSAVMSALAWLLRPGGVMFTTIPNMRGAVGALQKFVNREIYDIHVPLSAAQLRRAHEEAGLSVVSCRYFLPMLFGVLNLGKPRRNKASWWAKRIIVSVLARASLAVCALDRAGLSVPESSLFSPYVVCVAEKTPPGGWGPDRAAPVPPPNRPRGRPLWPAPSGRETPAPPDQALLRAPIDILVAPGAEEADRPPEPPPCRRGCDMLRRKPA